MFPSRSSLFGKTSAPSHATGDAKTPVQSHVAGEQSLGAKQSSASGESSTKVPDKPFQLNLQHHRSLERTAGTEKQRAENPYRRASEGSPFTGELPVYVYAALASFEESAEGVEDASEHSSRTVDAGEDEDAKIIERRRLFRKTSTEHTIIKDLEENFARGSSSGALAVTAATSKPPSRLSRSSRGDESADSIGSQRATTIPHDASSLSANGVPDPSAHRSSITQLQEKLAESGAGLDDLTTLQDRLRRLKDRLGDHSAFGSMGGMAPPGVFSHANSQRHGSLVPAEPLLSILKNPTRNGSKSVQGVAPVPVTVAISEPQYKIQATHARSEDLLSRGSEVAKKRGVKNGTPPSAAHSYDFLERGASLPASTHPYSIPVIPQTPPRVEGTLPVFVYLEDDTCNMFTVTPNTTINEVRMSALSQLGVSDAIESFSVFFMVKGVNGEPQESRVDPNIPVDHLSLPAPETIKVRLRRKSAVRWSVPIIVDERVQRQRWVLVEESTKVEDIVKLLYTIERKDDTESWSLFASGPSNTGALRPDETPFRPWVRDERYYFRQSHVRQRSQKLAAVLGLPASTDMGALADREALQAQDLKRRNDARKSVKLTNLLGIADTTPPPTRAANSKRRKRPSTLNLVFDPDETTPRRRKSSVEPSTPKLLDDDEEDKVHPVAPWKRYEHLQSKPAQVMRPRSKSDLSEAVISSKVRRPSIKQHSRSRQPSVTGKRLYLFDKMRGSAPGDALSSDSGASEDADEPTETVKRKEKLTDFFGVAKAKDVAHIERHANISKPDKLIRQPSDGSESHQTHFIVRVYFGNLTYSAIRMPVEATATHAKGLLLAKLSINNSGEMFGLFVHSPDGKERELTADERLYNVMLSWATTEYFLFKNRPVNNQLRHKRLSTQSVDASQFQLNEPAPQARRVAKLAGFFGLAPSPTATTPIPESLGKNLIHQPSEYEDLQTIFNQLSNVTTSSSLQANLRRRKSLAAPQAPQGGQPPGPERLGVLRKEFTSSIAALSTTLYKEGWMEVLINPTAVNAKKPWTCVWAKLDGDVLTVFPNERDEAVAGTPTAGSLPDRAATRVRLQGCTVVTGEGVVSKRQFVFTVVEAAQSVGVAEVVGAAAGSKASPPPPTAAAGATTTSNDKPKSLVLATKSATEMIDWIDCIRTSARRRPPTTSFSASRDSMHDHSQHPSRKTSVPVPPRTSTHTSTRPSVAANNNTTSLIPTDLEDPSLLLPTSSSHASEDETTLTMADFELHRVIGRGKYAKVLLCSRKSTNNVYAIKVLNKRRSISSSLGDGGEGDANEEGRILRSIHHPFIVGLHYAFQSADRLYLVMEYINGGELYFHVSRFGRFGEERVRFYCAELVLALQCLHDKGIVYRDLKLENILLSREGHVKITDFGLSKQETEDEESDSEADMVFVVGTLEYLSPEVLEGYPHTAAADLWALGVVTFEMLCGYHPFHSEDREEIQANILESPVEFPEWVSPEAKDFIAGLLKRNPRLRLKGEAIRKHPFFAGVDWRKLFDLEVEVPFKPELTGDYDVSFFEAEFTEEAAVLTPDGSRPSLEDRGGYQEQQPHHGENDSSHAEEDVDARMRSID